MLFELKAVFGHSSLKDYTSSQYGLLGFGAAIGAGALIAICLYQKHRRKKRKMSSFPDVSNNVTIMGKHLTPDIFSKLKDKYTSRQYRLDDLISSGLACHVSDENTANLLRLIENPSGLLAGDEECYDVFRDLIDPVVSEVHRINQPHAFISKVNMDWTDIEGGKFNGTKVVSCRLSTSRNIRDFNLIPGCSGLELEKIGRLIMKTLRSLKDVLPQQQHTMSFTSDHCLDPGPLSQQLSRDWPKGRFVWWTEDRRSRIFGNFWDHMKLVVTQPGGDMLQAFRRYCELLSGIQEALASSGKEFMWSRKYGFLTSSPKDIGTGLHVEVKIRFAKLIEDPRLPRIIDVLPVDLEKGVDPKNRSIASVTNKHKINLSEVEIVQQVVNSVTLLLELDRRLMRGENVQDLLP